MDISSILEGASRERTERVCLRPDLVDAYRRLAKAGAGDSLAGPSQALAEAKAAIEAATIPIRLRKLPRRQWDQLISADYGDGHVAADTQIKACVVEPRLPDDQWEQLFEALTSQDYNRLYSAVLDLNARAVDIPN